MGLTRFMVVVERGETSWGAHVPDLPGCVAVGESREEVLRLIREAIEFHIDGLKQDGLPVPPDADLDLTLTMSPAGSDLGAETTFRLLAHGEQAHHKRSWRKQR